MTERVLSWLEETSWQLAVLVLLVLVVQRLTRRWLTPRWSYALWLLVALRLLVPIQPSVPAGVWRDPLRPPPAALPAGPGQAFSLRREGPARAKSAEPAPGEAEPAAHGSGRPGRTYRAASRAPLPDEARGFPVARTLYALYLAGVLVALLRMATSELLFRRRLGSATRITRGRLPRLLRESRAELGLRREVELLETDAVSSPAVLGVRRPRLLFPPGAVAALDDEELHFVILHELAHVRRGDVALNALLALLRCVYWFHPLVHLAVARLQAAQESVRDWEALAIRKATSPRCYADTLIKLLQRAPGESPSPALGFLSSRRQLKRRILMIARFEPRRHSRALGTALLLTVGWVAFTSAAPGAISAPDEEPQALRSIHVERYQETPGWKEALEEQLRQSVSVGLQGASFQQAIDVLRDMGVNFVVSPEVLDELEGEGFTFAAESIPLGQALSILCRMAGDELGFTLVRESVFIGWRDSLPRDFELSFYDVGELIQASGEDEDYAMDNLIELIWNFVGPPQFWDEYEEASIRTWNDLFVVSQTETTHAELRAFLEQLLNEGERPAAAPEPWREALATALRQEIDVDFHGTDLREVIQLLGQAAGVPILLDRDRFGEPLSLQVTNMELGNVLDWVADLAELNVRIADGAIVLDESYEYSIEAYPVRDLVSPDDDFGRDNLEELIRDSVGRETWDEWEEPRLAFWGDLLVVKQTPAVHARLASFLAALRRASR